MYLVSVYRSATVPCVLHLDPFSPFAGCEFQFRGSGMVHHTTWAGTAMFIATTWLLSCLATIIATYGCFPVLQPSLLPTAAFLSCNHHCYLHGCLPVLQPSLLPTRQLGFLATIMRPTRLLGFLATLQSSLRAGKKSRPAVAR